MTQKTPHPGNVYAGLHDNVARLKAAYPHQFKGPSISHDWPDGWHHLVEEACAAMRRHHPEGCWRQIKEKFGGLRLYSSPEKASSSRGAGPLLPTVFQSVLEVLEQTSLQTCCLCGGKEGPGREITVGGWIITACETCEPLIRAHRALPYGER